MSRTPLLLALAAALVLALAGSTRHVVDVEVEEGLAPRPSFENAPAVVAAFLHAGYRPGDTAQLALWKPERGLTLQLFHAGPEDTSTVGYTSMEGVPVTAPVVLGARRAHDPIAVTVGDWPSGLYFARLSAPDGRVGFAPFVVAPRRLGEHRVLVVLPTYTWQAYNFRDDDADGRGDTWYAGWKQDWTRLARPFMSRGVPPHFRQYDLAFLHWLAHTGRSVDFLDDRGLQLAPSANALARDYDLIVFPGHHEYVTQREYDLVERYRDLGGNLAFLAANDFFWRVEIRHGLMRRTAKWRDLGRPEAALVGVQFIGTDEGHHRAPWVAERNADGLLDGVPAQFGTGGIEIDHTSSDSPPGIQVLAEIPHLFGDRFTAQMTYYETPGGAKVFAAGAFSVAAEAERRDVAALLANVWTRLTERDADGRDEQEPVSHRPTVQAAFDRESYHPGETARLVLFGSAPRATLRVYRVGDRHGRLAARDVMRGDAVTLRTRLGRLTRGAVARVALGARWQSGLYYAELTAPGGRVGYAPFVLAPRRLGEHRIAIVLPTQTWQAYNFRDDDGDGRPDTWYADQGVITTARLARPFENRGVPPHYRLYDEPFLRWVARQRLHVDFLSDAELRSASGDQLADAYDLLVFEGHHEYVTQHEYDAVTRFRDRGGNLMFLSANNFYWKITIRGDVMTRVAHWREIGRPEASLIGVQFYANDLGEHRKPWTLRTARDARWIFAGTGLRPGAAFSSGGIEADEVAPASPRGTEVLAAIPNLFGDGHDAEMSYYETPAGAKVFAAGAFSLAGSIWQPPVRAVVGNLIARLSRP